MRNLVTGGSGFIGAHLVSALQSRGEAVRVFDTREPEPALSGVDYLCGSINDEKTLTAAFRGCDRVFHLAAIAQLWIPDRRQFERVNIEGTRNVLNAARKADIERVIHVSSETALIDTRCGRRPQYVNENHEVRADHLAGPYCVSKWQAEHAAREAVQRHGQHVVICTPTVPVGPGDPWLTPPSRMLLALVNRQLPAWLETALNYVDVRDVAEGLVCAAERGQSGQRYLLGGQNLSMANLLARLERLSGVRMPRLRVPWPVAWAAAQLGEAWADRISGKPPAAPLTGVRLARAHVEFDNSWTREQLDWEARDLDLSLGDMLEDFRRRDLWMGSSF